MDEIELNNLNHEKDLEREEETDFGGSDENDLLDNLDWLSNRGKEVIDINHMDPINRLFGDKVHQARNTGFLIRNVSLVDSNEALEYFKPKFIKYLIKKRDFEIKKYYQQDHNY